MFPYLYLNTEPFDDELRNGYRQNKTSFKCECYFVSEMLRGVDPLLKS